MTSPLPRSSRWLSSLDAIAMLLLGGLVAALHPGLALGGVLADLDAFGYFLPYREAAAQALRAGRLPLWNPLLFGGAPLLANIQAAVFYPATWLGVIMETPRAVALTLLVHLWLAGVGMYWLCRAGLRLGRLAAWLGGAVFCLSGTLAAHAGHLNQLTAAAWLPWLALLYELARRSRSLPLATLGGGVFALQLLAGHPQVSYLSGAALGALALWRVWEDLRPRPPSLSSYPTQPPREQERDDAAVVAQPPGWRLAVAHRVRSLGRAGQQAMAAALSLGVLAYLLGLGAALAAVQLLPTAELSAHSIRAGGMTMEQAASFSLPPWELLRGLLPAYQGYPFGEYIAYLGVGPLVLAASAIQAQRAHPWTVPLALLAGAALLLALGHHLPLYWATYHALPGASLFRVPARWLLLWSFAVAGLAAIGLHLVYHHASRPPGSTPSSSRHDIAPPTLTAEEERKESVVSLPLGRWAAVAAAAGRQRRLAVARGRRVLPLLGIGMVLALIILSAWHNTLPAPVAIVAWVLAGGLTAAALWLAARSPEASGGFDRLRRPLLAVAVVVGAVTELGLARQGLALLTAYPPELATNMRPSFAAVMELGREGRILSLVDTRFEPGDAEAVRARLSPPLTPEQADTWLSFAKMKEAGAPNTGLLTGIGSLDGYDGGLLPLRTFLDLKHLLIASAARRAPPHLERQPPQPDGLLRLEVPGLPDAGLLAAVGVRGVVMDRLHDAWADGGYYDLALVRLVEPRATLRLARLPDVQATAVGLVTYLEGAAAIPDGAPVAEVRLYDGDGGVTRALLRAGQDTSEGRFDTARPRHARARAVATWRAGGGQSYLARLPLPAPRYVQRVEIESLLERGRVALHGLSLLDERLGASEPVVLDPAFRLTYLGDLKVYENLAWLPGVWAVFNAVVVPPADAAAVPGVLPNNVLLPRQPDGPVAALVRPLAEADQGGAAPAPLRTTRASPEQVVAEANLPQPALVVFPEAAYSGWTATVDGQPAALLPANVLFQAVYVPEGRHRVELRFEAPTLHLGWTVTRTALAWSALVFAAWELLRRWRWQRQRAAAPTMTAALY